ncbi:MULTISPECIES: TOBE domain-containing protein [Streptomyces]|uniref:Molybdenum-binding protein n=1 Tax=Streptomyces spororaveus TaxID=284039 RepID=A0ABQ3T7U2_9ACTN|nr:MULTISPECIES: TOBE domain-containing protein [Streptomyces]MCM9083294.1 TOBE domain-containing protein [Streptomyces spororaveus]MCX5302105.1 TOBE domain-containing protein [Streptomyces sp. NBC_00160]GHI76435.1 molybdenum-binding protein [Streptomyces spororaveus]
MSLSIRNQLAGTVTAVTVGEAMATVKVRLDGGQEITAAITAEAVKALRITSGSAVKALVKATEVALATAPVENISIRNQITGTVADIAVGPAMAAVNVNVNGGGLTAAVTAGGVQELGLAPGSSVVALIKSTEISLATV